MVSLQSEINGQILDPPIWNASGAFCTTAEELAILAGHPSTGAVTSKSCTLEPRDGNPHPRYAETKDLSINSTGLANHGYLFYQEQAKIMTPTTTKTKPYFISVAGLSLADNMTIVETLATGDIQEIHQLTGIELNLSCPNIVGKSQVGYDFPTSEEYLRKIYERIGPYSKLGLKLPPYFDLAHFQSMADIVSQYPVSFLTCINSLGRGLVLDPETDCPLIKPNNGLGGVGGSVVKPFALANVCQFYQLVNPDKVKIIGCGGVQTGVDAYQHFLVGASAVQIGTQLMREGPEVFTRVSDELRQHLQDKEIFSLDQVIGRFHN